MAVEQASAGYELQNESPALPVGYKQTEAGLIPEDWDVRLLGELVSFLDGQRRPIKSSDREKIKGEIPYYGASGVVDFVNDYIFDEELILLGEDGENILSRNLPLAFRISGKSWVNNHAHVMRPNHGISLGYLTEYLESLNYENLNSGTAQPKLNKKTCQKIKIAIPADLTEQQAIASALNDVDALLEELDRLIAKKRDLKQATMQQLLTGQTRLPGFEGEWKEVTMRDVLVQAATYGIVTAGRFVSNGVKMLRGGDISDGRISTDLPMVSDEKSFEYQRTVVRENDIVIALVGYPGAAAVVPLELAGANISRAVGLLRLNSEVDPSFMTFFLNSPDGRKMVLAPSAGSAQLVVNLSALNKLMFRIPPIDEQLAIAEILEFFDEEFVTLNLRRRKALALKQAMMSELLTGRTRLL